MKLSYLTTNVLFENVEALRPHLAKAIADLLPKNPEAMRELGIPSRMAGMAHGIPEDLLNKAVDWVLQSDPKFMKMQNKPPNRQKAPFAKQIINWWLAAPTPIRLPEDIETTRDILDRYNRFKQRPEFTKTNITDYESRDDLIAAMRDVMGDDDNAEAGFDRWKQMGLPKVAQVGDYSAYRIDKYISAKDWIESGHELPEAKSTDVTRGGDDRHYCMLGTSWCVQYKGTFERSYKPPIYYLVTKGNSRIALVHFGSGQVKDPDDREISGDGVQALQPLLQQIINNDPEASNAFLVGLSGSYNNLDKYGLELPPKAYEVALQTGGRDVLHALHKINSTNGKDNTEVEQRLLRADIEKGSKFILDDSDKFGPGMEQKVRKYFIDVITKSENKAQTVRDAISWIFKRNSGRWPELESILQTMDGGVAEKLCTIYHKYTGVDPHTGKEPATAIDVINQALRSGRPLPPAYESILLSDIDQSLQYLENIRSDTNWPELEAAIADHGTPAQRQYLEEIKRYS